MVPVISVVVPVYNEESIIKEFLIQWVRVIPPEVSYQLVIVDNASGDKTREFLSRFHEENPMIPLVIVSEKRRGIAFATKKGFSYALNSKVLVKLDADSRIASDFLVSIWQEFAKEGTDGITGLLQFSWDASLLFTPAQRRLYQQVAPIRKKMQELIEQWFWPSFDGPFYAVTSASYKKSRGIITKAFVLRYEDDVGFAARFSMAGYKIRKTNIAVIISPRRMLEEFEGYVSGRMYWDEQSKKPIETSKIDYSEKFPTNTLLLLANTYTSIALRLATFCILKKRPEPVLRLLDNMGVKDLQLPRYPSAKKVLVALQKSLGEDIVQYIFHELTDKNINL